MDWLSTTTTSAPPTPFDESLFEEEWQVLSHERQAQEVVGQTQGDAASDSIPSNRYIHSMLEPAFAAGAIPFNAHTSTSSYPDVPFPVSGTTTRFDGSDEISGSASPQAGIFIGEGQPAIVPYSTSMLGLFGHRRSVSEPPGGYVAHPGISEAMEAEHVVFHRQGHSIGTPSHAGPVKRRSKKGPRRGPYTTGGRKATSTAAMPLDVRPPPTSVPKTLKSACQLPMPSISMPTSAGSGPSARPDPLQSRPPSVMSSRVCSPSPFESEGHDLECGELPQTQRPKQGAERSVLTTSIDLNELQAVIKKAVRTAVLEIEAERAVPGSEHPPGEDGSATSAAAGTPASHGQTE